MLSRARAIPPLDRLLAGETSGAARPVAEEDKTDWQRDFDREWREAQQSE